MKNRKTICALSALAVLGSVCAQRVETEGKAAEEIARLLEVHRSDYLKGDADAWAALYAEDATFAGDEDSREVANRQPSLLLEGLASHLLYRKKIQSPRATCCEPVHPSPAIENHWAEGR
jgi:hypothetical protein